MSQLRLLKPSSVFKNVLRHKNVRLFSSTPTYPFMLIDYLLNIQDSYYDGRVATCYELDYPNCCKKGIVIVDSKLRDEVRNAMTFGFSRNGSLTFTLLDKNGDDDNSLRIRINHNPSNLDVEAVLTSLPPLPSGSKIQNIAMSCLPLRDKDWVVGVKFSGSRLSLCRPFGNPKWINIKAMPESISPFSSLMFSKKDQKFYIPSPGGEHLCSLDLHFKEEDQPEFIYMLFDDLPNSVLGELDIVSPCSKTYHLVESPTGELFLVKWYGEDLDEDYDKVGLRSLMHITNHFMVFRAEETGDDEVDKNMIYTEDIGDLCIFLGHSEAICVPASSSPGRRPNCIYFVGYNFGVYDLTTKTCTNFFKKIYKKDKELLRDLKFPYWPLPLPLD